MGISMSTSLILPNGGTSSSDTTITYRGNTTNLNEFADTLAVEQNTQDDRLTAADGTIETHTTQIGAAQNSLNTLASQVDDHETRIETLEQSSGVGGLVNETISASSIEVNLAGTSVTASGNNIMRLNKSGNSTILMLNSTHTFSKTTASSAGQAFNISINTSSTNLAKIKPNGDSGSQLPVTGCAYITQGVGNGNVAICIPTFISWVDNGTTATLSISGIINADLTAAATAYNLRFSYSYNTEG